MGVISAIGGSGSESLRAFEYYQSGIGPLKYLDTIHVDSLPAGEVKQSNDQLQAGVLTNGPITRTALLGIHAANEAIKNAGIPDLKKWRTGLISATTVGGM